MNQSDKVLELINKYKDNVRKEFGDFKVDKELKDGKIKVILTDGEDNRFHASLIFSSEGVEITAIPEEEGMEDITLTQLEHDLLQTAVKRAIIALTRKFSERTGWELIDLGAVFVKGDGRIFASYDGQEITILEGEFANWNEEKEEE